MRIYYYYAGAEGHLIVAERDGKIRILSEADFTGDIKTLREKMFDVPDAKKGLYGQTLYALEWMDLVAHAILDLAAEADGWKLTTKTKEEIMLDRRLVAAEKREVLI